MFDESNLAKAKYDNRCLKGTNIRGAKFRSLSYFGESLGEASWDKHWSQTIYH